MNEARFANMPMNISVPNYPKLRAYDSEQESLKAQIETQRKQLARLEYEGQTIDRELAGVSGLDSMSQSSRNRARIKAEIESLEGEIARAEKRLQDSYFERQTWVDNFAVLLHKQQTLSRELANTTGDRAYDFVISDNPESRQRSKTDVENDLLECVQTLALWSGDKKLAEEAQSLEKEIANTRPFIITEQCWYLSPQGELLPESEVTSGCVTKFGKGVRVDREEAKRWGLQEAQ